VILLVASRPTHLNIVGPLARMYGFPVIYGGARSGLYASKRHEAPGWHITGYLRPPLRFWSRPAWLRAAVRCALRTHKPNAVIVTSARYHLEQAFLEVAPAYNVKRIAWLSTAIMEANKLFQRHGGKPRMQFYDVGDELWVVGDHLRDQLIENGVNPARIQVMGSPYSLEKFNQERADIAAETICSLA
jgi:hypothetical protein